MATQSCHLHIGKAHREIADMTDRSPGTLSFSILGLCLPRAQIRDLFRAFSGNMLHLSDADTLEDIHAVCVPLGKLVIFSYIPELPAPMSLRLSTVFSHEDVKVIGLHPQCSDEVFKRALDNEFAGVLSMDAEEHVWRLAASAVHRGELWFPRSYLSRRLRETLHEAEPRSLSDREIDILRLLAAGATNHTIAEKLFISRDTVRWHLRSIYAKLGVSDRTAAFRFAKNKLRQMQSLSSSLQ